VKNWLHKFLHKPRTRAQSLVEFALALPIFLMLVLGVIEFGHLLAIYSSVYTASREAARYGSAIGISESGVPYYQDCDGIKAAALRVGFFAGIEASQVDIRYDNGPNDDIPWDTLAACPSTVVLSDRIVVRVTADYAPIIPFLGIPSFPIVSTAARTIVIDVDVMGTPLPSPTPRPTRTPTPTITPTETSTITPGPSPTPTDTPTVTETFTPTLTYTVTVTRTPTNTRTPTSTDCPPEICTPTYTVTVTNTRTITPTRTPTPTKTMTPTRTPNCYKFYAAGAKINGKRFNLDLWNSDNTWTITIDSIEISWGTTNKLLSIQLGSVVLWSNATGVSPSFTLDVSPSSDVQIPPASLKNLQLTYSDSVTVKPSVTVRLDNMICTIVYTP
jgi:hypothetical protein